jgi:pyruvate-ferredoxin/flavodoxin oxidoreductase
MCSNGAQPGAHVPAQLRVRARRGLGIGPRSVQEQIIAKKLKMYAIDGSKVALDAGMGSRVNTIMQTCFFAISGVLPRDEAIAKIKYAIKKTYGRKGEDIVKKNFKAVDMTLATWRSIPVPATATSTRELPPTVSARRPPSCATSPPRSWPAAATICR